MLIIRLIVTSLGK